MSTNNTNFVGTNNPKSKEIDRIFKNEVCQATGAAMEVHKQPGRGFLEPVYQAALEKEFASQKIPFKTQYPLKIFYTGEPLRKQYITDFVVFGSVIMEIKALDQMTGDHGTQILN